MARFSRALGLSVCILSATAFRGKKLEPQCGKKGGTSNKIVNGADAEECEWKWQVNLRTSDYKDGTEPFCGGMLIDKEWVLTAAHCTASTRNFWVVAGDYDVSKPSAEYTQKVDVELVEEHPNYDSRTTNYDYALVKLTEKVNLTDCVGTVCLPADEDDDVEAGDGCWITGWGTLKSGGTSPDILQEAEVSIISNSECVTKFDYSPSQITNVMICAQGKNGSLTSDACQGDSGGPLVCSKDGVYKIYGATSWGRGCALPNYPGIWSRVASVRSWIDDVMDGTYQSPKCPVGNPKPDSDGDCRCPRGQKCSTTGEGEWNCPNSGGLGAYGGYYFFPNCTRCECY